MPGKLLIKLMDRLEAATSRLEDMAQATTEPGVAAVTANGTGVAGAAVGGAMGATAGALAATSPGVGPTEVLPASIEGFDTLINDQVTKFVNLSEELGGVVAEQVQRILGSGERRMLTVTSGIRSSPSIRCRTADPHRRNSSEETRRLIFNVHGDFDGPSTTDQQGL